MRLSRDRRWSIRTALLLATLTSCGILAGCGNDSGTAPHDHDDHDHGDPVAGNCGHIEAEGFVLEESGGSILVSAWQGAQSGALQLRAGEASPLLHLRFLDADSTLYAIADTCSINHLDCIAADSSLLSVQRDPGVQWSFRLIPRAAGATTLVLDCYHEDHVHFSCAPIPVTVAPEVESGRRLSGHVRLRADLTGETGAPEGIRRLEDANGVRVYLLRENLPVDSTLTQAGAWDFRGLPAADYRVSVRRPDGTSESSPVIRVDDGDALADTLELGPSGGDIKTYPNPFAYSHGVGIEFSPAGASPAMIRILDVGGHQVWSHSYTTTPGLQHIHWIGTDGEQIPLPAGAYWAVVEVEGTARWNLVLKEAAAAR